MYDKDDEEMTVLDGIVRIICFILAMIIAPFLCFVFGWIIGLIIKTFFADIFIEGIALLNITLTADKIPLLCGIINVLASFFKQKITPDND